MRILILLLCLHSLIFAENNDEHRVLICGVCRNVSAASENSIRNIEELGRRFKDYAVIIYENNSLDDTAQKFSAWASSNNHVTFISETLSKKELAQSRTCRIANARNKVLEVVRKEKYDKFRYLIMVDLDFRTAWPIDEIIHSVNQAFDWDSISANGITATGTYYDRFAFRSKDFPFGPELLDHEFWAELLPNDQGRWFKLPQATGWMPVYSAFGGLAIYKTETIRKFSYSGSVTPALKKYYKNILSDLSPDHPHLVKYRTLNKKHSGNKVIFRKNCLEWQSPKDRSIAVCEHVTLHAAMALKGYRAFYVNPKLVMQY